MQKIKNNKSNLKKKNKFGRLILPAFKTYYKTIIKTRLLAQR